jgi:PDZ domain
MKMLVLLAAFCVGSPACANDWEKFYTNLNADGLIASSVPPEVTPSTGNVERDLEAMWRKGFVAIGYSSFNTGNSKTNDAVKLARKLRARFLIVSTQLTSSDTTTVPMTMPNTTTSQTNGTASVYGSGGYANGSYSGTTTTYGTQTTYIPVTVNRFDKNAVFFQEAPKSGTGIYTRELTPDEMIRLDTRRAFVVRFVRDASPAFNADVFPGDIVVSVNGQLADLETWNLAIRDNETLAVRILRNGQQREVKITIPADWKPK